MRPPCPQIYETDGRPYNVSYIYGQVGRCADPQRTDFFMMESQRSDLASWLQELDSRVALQHPVVKHTWGVLMTVVDNPEIPEAGRGGLCS
jgi:hypothetical protein